MRYVTTRPKLTRVDECREPADARVAQEEAPVDKIGDREPALKAPVSYWLLDCERNADAMSNNPYACEWARARGSAHDQGLNCKTTREPPILASPP